MFTRPHNLAPEHLVDLRKSGLSDETIQGAKIDSVPSDLIAKKLGYIPNNLKSMYEIPFGDNGYSRFKLFYAQGNNFYKDGKPKPKYLTKKGAGNRVYIPKKVAPVLKDVSIPLYITEGEKKALKACQEGLYCIAICRLWNWKVKGKDELIPDFGKIAIDGRTIYIVPDNDWQNPNRKGEHKNLIDAVNDLGYLLIDRGAKVYWIELPLEET